MALRGFQFCRDREVYMGGQHILNDLFINN